MEENRESIYTIQRDLRRLTVSGWDIPLINPDGIFGAETEAAVKAFQTQMGLAATGKVDFETWKRLREEGQSAQSSNF